MTFRFYSILAASLFFSSLVFAQNEALVEYDYRDVGLLFSVPDSWTHNGMMAKTKAEFIAEFGWNYTRPDAKDLWHAYGSFIGLDVDSTLVPSDSAYALHKLTIFVERSPTWVKQWLCRLGRRSIWGDDEAERPEMEVVNEWALDRVPIKTDFFGGYGKVFELKSRRTVLPILRHEYSFVHKEKCYQIKLESTAARKADSVALHERVLDSFRLVEF